MTKKTFLLAFVSLIASILGAGKTPAATAPIAFYSAEGNGNDTSGGGHPANVPVLDVDNPGLSYTTGKVGQGFAFTGPSGSPSGTYVVFGNWFTFQSFTLAMW